jgi:predicted ATP-grasp superfamily ATP-dependent carboligase
MQGERVWVLELNPRLSATLDLYPTQDGQLFELHMRASAGGSLDGPLDTGLSKAHYIVYAPENISLPEDYAWPAWVADIPADGALITAGDPVCTAEAQDPEQAVQLMAERVRMLVRDLI